MTDRLRAYLQNTPEAQDLPEAYGTDSGPMLDDIAALLAEVDRLRAQVRRTVFAKECCGNEW